MMNPKNEEARLLRRIAHLHTILRYADDPRIVLTLREFIAETETRVATLQGKGERKATLH